MRAELQATVYQAVRRRGGAQGTVLAELRAQTLESAAAFGRVCAYVDVGRAVPVEELGDVVIPLLVIAAIQGDDLLAAVLEKVRRDVERGRRDE